MQEEWDGLEEEIKPFAAQKSSPCYLDYAEQESQSEKRFIRFLKLLMKAMDQTKHEMKETQSLETMSYQVIF